VPGQGCVGGVEPGNEKGHTEPFRRADKRSRGEGKDGVARKGDGADIAPVTHLSERSKTMNILQALWGKRVSKKDWKWGGRTGLVRQAGTVSKKKKQKRRAPPLGFPDAKGSERGGGIPGPGFHRSKNLHVPDGGSRWKHFRKGWSGIIGRGVRGGKKSNWERSMTIKKTDRRRDSCKVP